MRGITSRRSAHWRCGDPDIDDLFIQQGRERDPKGREALLHKIQELTIDCVMFAPIMDYRTLRGVGPRIAEDMRLKSP